MISQDAEQLGILPTDEARRRAEEAGLDLVEVSPNARPPVCKIMDFGKFKYDQKRKANEQKKKQHTIEVKEVKFRPKTDKHDFDVKVNRLTKFLKQGNKIKVTIMFRGREIIHPEIGHDILRRVAEAVADIAGVESHARMEGRQMFMILAPGKVAGRPAQGQGQRAPAPQGAPAKDGPQVSHATSAKPPPKQAQS